LISVSDAFAQTSYHVTTGQGLATNQLTILIKDRQNNMWFGSYNGLHKHEGTSIKVFRKNNKDSTSLSSNEMHSIFEDRLGFIWAGTTGGLDKLNPKTQAVKHYKLKSNKRNDDWLGYIYNIFQDDKDNIWVYAQAGMFVLNYESGSYTQILTDEKSGRGIPAAGLLYKGSLTTKTGVWMFSGGYIVFFDFKTRQFFHHYNNPENKKIFKLSEGNKSELCIDNANNLYFVFNNTQLYKYNIVTEKLDSFSFQFPKAAWSCCYSLATDFKGNVWIGFRYGGILFFNSAAHQFTPIRYTDANSLIQSDYIYSLQEDYLKRMWVTTDNGIFIVNYYDSVVQQKYLSDKKEFISINYMADLMSQDDKGNIYVPFSAGGLFKYNVFSGSSRYFAVSDPVVKSYNYVYTDDKSTLFVSYMGYLLQADSLKDKLTLSAVTDKLNKAIKAETSVIIWMYKNNQQSVYIKKSNGYIYYYNGTDSLEKLESTGYAKLACASNDRKNLYFLSKENTIIKRNFNSLKTDSFPLGEKLQALNFSYSSPRDMADDGKGNIWITSQNGLVKYNLQKQTVVVYTSADGLLHDLSFTLCVDSKKRLWVGTMGGVNLYDEQKNTFINVFTEAPGKVANYFGSSLEAKDGHVYFLFGGKLVNIDPDGFLRQRNEGRILKLYEVSVNGNTVPFSANSLSHLSYGQNRISFRFGLLEFTDPEKVNYFYQLKGLDKSWVNLGNHSEVIFNSLQPGKYTLNVKATDVYGNLVKEQLSISFTITPPFWKTWWFSILVALCTFYIIYRFIKWRVKNIKAIEAEKLKVQLLNAEQYKSKLELEQIINYFSSSLINKHTVNDVLWDVAKNLIGRLGFVDCMIYLWNDDKTKMVQKAGHGPKDSEEEISKQLFTVLPGQGLVGYVMQTKEAVVIADTAKDSRYRPDDIVRLSEITVPIIYNDELIGVIDSEHPEKNFYTPQHLQLLTTIATLVANKIKSIEAEQMIQQKSIEMYSINEQLSKAKLEALRSQMNPHFIFNSLNAIQECILTNNVDAAYKYLSKFSKLQRMVLNNSQKELIPLSSEIEMLQLYLSLESLRFSKSFVYHIAIAGITDANEIMIPSLITQPLVENAIWHGLRNKEGDKKLDILYEEKNAKIFITIDDNGIGREAAAAIKKQKIGREQFDSKGTVILQQRLQVLSQQLKADILLETTDKKDESGNATGTNVIISFASNLETE
jgi:ligand-binding sensor domain-containing protein/putative methionine-R-sulfoxide reductase with GAF domain